MSRERKHLIALIFTVVILSLIYIALIPVHSQNEGMPITRAMRGQPLTPQQERVMQHEHADWIQMRSERKLNQERMTTMEQDIAEIKAMCREWKKNEPGGGVAGK